MCPLSLSRLATSATCYPVTLRFFLFFVQTGSLVLQYEMNCLVTLQTRSPSLSCERFPPRCSHHSWAYSEIMGTVLDTPTLESSIKRSPKAPHERHYYIVALISQYSLDFHVALFNLPSCATCLPSLSPSPARAKIIRAFDFR